MKKRAHRGVVIATIIVAVITGLATVLFISGALTQTSSSNDSPRPADLTVTVQGDLVCLPHKNADNGPQTMECMLGLKAADGSYYGLRNLPQSDDFQRTEQKVKIRGLFVDPLTTEKYDIRGVIQVQRIEVQ